MEQKDMAIVNTLNEFQTSFETASPEEKQHLAEQFFIWAQQQPKFQEIIANKINAIDSHNPQQLTGSKPQLQDLAANEIHLKQILTNIEQVIWLREVNSGQIVYVSPGFETVWGRSCETLYSNPAILIESVHPEDRLQVMVARPHNGHKPYTQAYRILRPDGFMRWISARSFLVRDETGKPAYQFYIAEDISDHKQLEVDLRKTLDRVREQGDLSRKMSFSRKPEAVLKTLMSAHELRSALRATLVFFDNPKVGPSSGVELAATWVSTQNLPQWLSETALYEEPAFWELLRPKQTVVISGIRSDPRITPLLRDFLLEGKIQTVAIFPLVALGNWRGCLLVFYNYEHQFDHIELHHLKVLVDQASITLYNLQLLKIEEESRHEAERANEIKTKFLAMISHELRTPLTSIIGFTTTLLAQDVTWDLEEQHDFIQTIQQEANRLQELIDHLLDLSRLEAGMLPISQKLHSFKEILADALPQIHTLTEAHILTIHVPDDLPPVNADQRRIAQVLVNLVHNASSYSPPGTEINISAFASRGYIHVDVNDQGPGIPNDEHKRVFKAFQRGKFIEQGITQGAGLGLAICKGIVEAHGGRIKIKKKNSPGATISFTIPQAILDSPENPSGEEG